MSQQFSANAQGHHGQHPVQRGSVNGQYSCLCESHYTAWEREQEERKENMKAWNDCMKLQPEEIDRLFKGAQVSPPASPGYNSGFPQDIMDVDPPYGQTYNMYKPRKGSLAAAPSFNTLAAVAGAVDPGPKGILANCNDLIPGCIPRSQLMVFMPPTNKKVIFDVPEPERKRTTRTSPRKVRKMPSLDEVASRPMSMRAILEESAPSPPRKPTKTTTKDLNPKATKTTSSPRKKRGPY